MVESLPVGVAAVLAKGKTQISTNYSSADYRFGSFQGHAEERPGARCHPPQRDRRQNRQRRVDDRHEAAAAHRQDHRKGDLHRLGQSDREEDSAVDARLVAVLRIEAEGVGPGFPALPSATPPLSGPASAGPGFPALPSDAPPLAGPASVGPGLAKAPRVRRLPAPLSAARRLGAPRRRTGADRVSCRLRGAEGSLGGQQGSASVRPPEGAAAPTSAPTAEGSGGAATAQHFDTARLYFAAALRHGLQGQLVEAADPRASPSSPPPRVPQPPASPVVHPVKAPPSPLLGSAKSLPPGQPHVETQGRRRIANRPITPAGEGSSGGSPEQLLRTPAPEPDAADAGQSSVPICLTSATLYAFRLAPIRIIPSYLWCTVVLLLC